MTEGGQDSAVKVSRRVEEGKHETSMAKGMIMLASATAGPHTLLLCAALFYKLKEKAFKTCKGPADAYAACCSGRTFSMAWACRGELKNMSLCLGQQ